MKLDENFFMDLLSIIWEKGSKGSRILGFKCLFYRDLIIVLSFLSTSPLCIYANNAYTIFA